MDIFNICNTNNNKLKMENSQQTHNFFFAKISDNLKKMTPEKILRDLEIITLNETKNLSITQFELLGSLAYLTGIDFTSQTDKLNPKVLSNVTKRFVDQNLNFEIWKKFVEIINILHIDNLIEPKEAIKIGVTKEIPLTAQTIKLKHEITTIIKNSFIPVKFAANTDLLLKSKNLTYMQLLNFNSLVYEQMPLKGSTLTLVVNLFKTDLLKDLMFEASEKFDNQKYAIIYFDSLITLAEFNAAKQISVDVLFNENLINELIESEKNEESQESQEITKLEVVTEEATELEKPEISINDTDNFLKASIEESLERKIETSQDLIDGFRMVADNDDLMQHVYRYIRANQTKGRSKFEDVYTFSLNEVTDYYIDLLKTNVEKYNKLLLRYIEKIPENLFNRLVNSVNDVIKSLLISNSEHKGYLIQQLFENQIETYKQLHQTINIIESCEIEGSKINNYVALRDMIIYSDDIVNIFEESIELEKIKLELQFFTAVKEFFLPTPVENIEESNPAK